MTEFGYALSSEEHGPRDLVRYARRAEEVGFTFALVSDHFHPWVSRQGESPFVWTVLGGIARETERLQVGTGVTCPIMRLHPSIVAQASATVAASMPSRFFLGVGTGENLNEHVLGGHWPDGTTRLSMLEEAIGIIRALWTGESFSHRGPFFTVENARLFTLFSRGGEERVPKQRLPSWSRRRATRQWSSRPKPEMDSSPSGPIARGSIDSSAREARVSRRMDDSPSAGRPPTRRPAVPRTSGGRQRRSPGNSGPRSRLRSSSKARPSSLVPRTSRSRSYAVPIQRSTRRN